MSEKNLFGNGEGMSPVGNESVEQKKSVNESNGLHTDEEYRAAKDSAEHFLLRKEDATHIINGILEPSGGDISLVSPSRLKQLAVNIEELGKIYDKLSGINGKGEKTGNGDSYLGLEGFAFKMDGLYGEDVEKILQDKDNAKESILGEYADLIMREEDDLSKETYVLDKFYDFTERSVANMLENLGVSIQIIKSKGEPAVAQQLAEAAEEIKKDWQEKSGPRLKRLVKERTEQIKK
ncbi:MAG: hypothetical protein U0944_02275 [Candidatus Moranbacteria bacterium]|nr:hypothetical protein [Candidatus Moranbacteria bacterium]MDZ4385224.1 hypothetical protein [Candidatus Moranbacteria bacterium]